MDRILFEFGTFDGGLDEGVSDEYSDGRSLLGTPQIIQ
jgi:hypothetical protein